MTTGSVVGWPFLIGRGRTVGYRVLAAPDFMAEQAVAGVLADAAAGRYRPGASSAYRRELRGLPTGDLYLMYRVVPALAGRQEVTDRGGRPIRLVEGLVFKHPDQPQVSGADLDKAHELTWHAFEVLLSQDRDDLPIECSVEMPLARIVPGEPLRFDVQPPFISVGVSRPRVPAYPSREASAVGKDPDAPAAGRPAAGGPETVPKISQKEGEARDNEAGHNGTGAEGQATRADGRPLDEGTRGRSVPGVLSARVPVVVVVVLAAVVAVLVVLVALGVLGTRPDSATPERRAGTGNATRTKPGRLARGR